MKTALRRAQPWLGTLVEIGLQDYAGDAFAIFAAGFAAIERVHLLMSPQHAPSDIARFNAAAAGDSIECDAWTIEVLGAARELGLASDGIFDVTLGTGGPGTWSIEGLRLIKRQDRTRLDLGGIGKGEAVDRACAALQAAGADSGWVNAGGDLRSFGDIELPVHVRDPDHSGRLQALTALRDGAIATSDFPSAQGKSRYRQVSVAAPDCRWADALTKVVALAPDTAQGLLPRYHAQVWTTPHRASTQRVPASQ